MIKKIILLLKTAGASAALAVLSACGGGGGDGGTAGSENAAGFWIGDTTFGDDLLLIITPEGKAWGWQQDSASKVGRLFRYDIQVSASTVSGSGVEVRLPNWRIDNPALRGSVQPKSTLQATFGESRSIAFTYDNDYDRPASLTSLAGTFSLGGLTALGESAGGSATITSGGIMTVQGFANCNATGTLRPNTSGKGFFDLLLRFSGPFCALGNDVATTGVLVLANPTTLAAVGMTPSNNNGFFLGGFRTSN